jgi:hypothetical protein
MASVEAFALPVRDLLARADDATIARAIWGVNDLDRGWLACAVTGTRADSVVMP